MRRGLMLAAAACALLAAVLGIRTLRFDSRQLAVEALPGTRVDAGGAARRLAGGIRFRTISHQDAARLPVEAFDGFRRYLEQSYPRTHARLTREIVSGQSLLYTWRGTRPERAPGLLMAHHDVVPVDAGSEADWTHPPFAGEIRDGYVWGRGAMDDKGSLFCILEAVESLLAEGFQPQRTLYLSFGHDEEVGGAAGARAVAELLASRGTQLAYVVDEGGTVARGMIRAIARPVAVIGIAEKGSVGVGLGVETDGGHSSTPPKQTAIGILAAAIRNLERHPMPTRIGDTTRLMLRYLGPELSLPVRVVLANLWLFGRPLSGLADGQAALRAMTRTTTAATIFEGGVKENVLPRRAHAVVNFRILPGDSVEDVVAHVREVIADDRVELQVGVRSEPREASGVSRVDSESFAVLQRTIGEIFPEAIVAPYLVVGGTDARHFEPLSRDVYRFGPFEFGPDALKLAHGTDERISIENLERGVRFYRRFIASSTGPGD